jgi:YHS domain-containing protein
MKIQNDVAFGKLQINPVKVQRKGGLVLPEAKGMKPTAVAEVTQGKFSGRHILYLRSAEIEADYQGTTYYFIPTQAVLAFITIEDNEEVVSRLEIDRLYDKAGDAEWKPY